MSRTASVHNVSTPRSFGNGNLFGIPLRDLGWFGSLLIAVASGFLTFFATTFFSIFAILLYNAATHSTVDFAFSYRRVGLPCGLAVLAFASIYLARLWIKRMFHRG
ncbi:MAG TPA: hypothetical protein VHU44_02425 [Acidobacteriaceae bacterium]|jgi:hypothetical protein|nr:hypothetical protein [Acidobacteriaceae bacterium]